MNNDIDKDLFSESIEKYNKLLYFGIGEDKKEIINIAMDTLKEKVLDINEVKKQVEGDEIMQFNSEILDDVNTQELFSLKMKVWLSDSSQQEYFNSTFMDKLTNLVSQFAYIYSGYGDYGEGTIIDGRSGYFFKIFQGDKRCYHVRVSLSNPFKISILDSLPMDYIAHVNDNNAGENHKEVLEDLKTNLIQINKVKENLVLESSKKVDYTSIISMHSPDIAEAMGTNEESKENDLVELEKKAKDLEEKIQAKELEYGNC